MPNRIRKILELSILANEMKVSMYDIQYIL